jgi:hypothetical protein
MATQFLALVASSVVPDVILGCGGSVCLGLLVLFSRLVDESCSPAADFNLEFIQFFPEMNL